jgi:formylglycine-generating enzyme required for sulfatase activity
MTGFQLGQTEVSVDQYRTFFEKDAGTQLKAVLSGCGTLGTTITITATEGKTKKDFRGRVAKAVVSNSCDAMQIVAKTPKGMPNLEANKKGGQYPVVGLLMGEKRAYCRADGGDLATAAQLHFASRYDEQDSVSKRKDKRIIWDNGFQSTEPVTSGYQNRLGVYNLLGNVSESSLDAYDSKFYSRMSSQNPYNPMTDPRDWKTNREGQLQEFSGGSFAHSQRDARAANRSSSSPDNRNGGDGFRCARARPQDSK